MPAERGTARCSSRAMPGREPCRCFHEPPTACPGDAGCWMLAPTPPVTPRAPRSHRGLPLCSPEAAAGGSPRDERPTAPAQQHGDGVTADAAFPGCPAHLAALPFPRLGGSLERSQGWAQAWFLPTAPFTLELRCGKLRGRGICAPSDGLNRYSFPWHHLKIICQPASGIFCLFYLAQALRSVSWLAVFIYLQGTRPEWIVPALCWSF